MRQPLTVGRFPVVVFDLDGTLLRGTTVSLLLAQWLGRERKVSELERAFRAHEISNRVVADTSAGWLAGKSVAETWQVLMIGSWIDGMAETFQALAAAGVSLLLGTITWRFAQRCRESATAQLSQRASVLFSPAVVGAGVEVSFTLVAVAARHTSPHTT